MLAKKWDACTPNELDSILPISLFPLSSYEDANSVVTIGDGKFYSLGLDLEHLVTMAPYDLITFTTNLQKLLARLLTFPLVTVAAINGNIRD